MKAIDALTFLAEADPDSEVLVMPKRVFDYMTGRRDPGLNSQLMILHLLCGEPISGRIYPKDESDYRNCEYTLKLFPELQPLLPKMAELSEGWAEFVAWWTKKHANAPTTARTAP